MDMVLSIAWKRTVNDVKKRFGQPSGKITPEFLILGLGKFGARESSFHSDLDLVYIYKGEGKTEGGEESIDNSVYFTKVIEKMQRMLMVPTSEGKIVEVDPKLRPEGKSGPLVINVDRFKKYFSTEEAQPWEYQAYLRMRHVIGSRNLFIEVNELFWNRAKSLKERINVSETIYEMRQRLVKSVSLPSWAVVRSQAGRRWCGRYRNSWHNGSS